MAQGNMDIKGSTMVIQIMTNRGHIPMKCLRSDVHIVERLPQNMRHFAHIAELRFKEEKKTVHGLRGKRLVVS